MLFLQRSAFQRFMLEKEHFSRARNCFNYLVSFIGLPSQGSLMLQEPHKFRGVDTQFIKAILLTLY